MKNSYEHNQLLKMPSKDAAQHLEKFGLLIRVQDFYDGFEVLHYEYLYGYWFVDTHRKEVYSHRYCPSKDYYGAFGTSHLKTLKANGESK